MGSFIDGYLHSFKRHIEGVQEAEAARLGSQLAEQQGIANGMALTIADSALKAAGDKLGLSPVEINLARAELYKGMGDFEGATELYAGALEELPPFDRATVESSMSDGIEKLLEEILSTIRQRTTEQTGESNEGAEEEGDVRNFFQAMAKALGEMLGEKAAKLVASMDNMSEAGGTVAKPTGEGMVDSSTGKLTDEGKAEYQRLRENQAMQFSVAQVEFQADSQMYSMVTQMATTVIKQVGESLSTLARK
ncbi:MAG: hypothetical protein KUG82_14150 [Pseudomonadales bacterium]|nr:hypothetical protein [Pseudomonadales bacterium]